LSTTIGIADCASLLFNIEKCYNVVLADDLCCMKHITSCFSQNLVDICQKSFQSEKWQEIIRNYLSSPLNQHVYVGSFKQGHLILVVDCPLWASEIRMRSPEIRDYLRAEQQCYHLRTISIKIQPEFFKN
jgi:hypothetical protein